MRLIIDKTTKQILGKEEGAVTSHLPPSAIGDNSEYIDIDYNTKSLKKTKTHQLLDADRGEMLGKKLKRIGRGYTFEDIPPRFRETVQLDIYKPKFHKDVKIYAQKAREKGAIVNINDGGKNVFVTIDVGDKRVGRMHFIRRSCCTYIYQSGTVIDREYYPHYLGLEAFYEYLKGGKIRYIDMGGLLPKDEDLNKFKKKFGVVVSQMY